jgi:hypothetical protein
MVSSFNQNKYLVVKGFLDLEFVKFAQSYFKTRIQAGEAALGDTQAPRSFVFYGDPLVETILGASLSYLSEQTGIFLSPTYSYTRLYPKGEELKIHRDRPSCEISATLAWGFPESDQPSPIYFCDNEDRVNAKEIVLFPGDLCLYRGCDLWHWREPFTQEWSLQSFLHYIDSNGPYKENIYDGRPALGMPKQVNSHC